MPVLNLSLNLAIGVIHILLSLDSELALCFPMTIPTTKLAQTLIPILQKAHGRLTILAASPSSPYIIRTLLSAIPLLLVSNLFDILTCQTRATFLAWVRDIAQHDCR